MSTRTLVTQAAVTVAVLFVLNALASRSPQVRRLVAPGALVPVPAPFGNGVASA